MVMYVIVATGGKKGAGVIASTPDETEAIGIAVVEALTGHGGTRRHPVQVLYGGYLEHVVVLTVTLGRHKEVVVRQVEPTSYTGKLAFRGTRSLAALSERR